MTKKRNRYGVNFDPGIPLQSAEDFEILYIDANPDEKEDLLKWMKNPGEGPLILFGQIGTGKSTLIEKAFSEICCPDIRVGFDTEVPFYEPGAFWGILLGKITRYGLETGCDLHSFHLSEDLIGIPYKENGMQQLSAELCDRPLSFEDFAGKKSIYAKVEEKLEFIQRQMHDIISSIETKMNRRLFIFAEGVDKFYPTTAGYHALAPVLNFLSQYRTLFEANFIHLPDSTGKWIRDSKLIILPTVTDETCSEILRKRLGIYSKEKKGILPLLARLSGGNLRQALRLLMEYNYAFKKSGEKTDIALHQACRRVKDDFLKVPTGSIDYELLRVVDRDHYLSPGILKDLLSSEEVYDAVYRNYIHITGSIHDKGYWPAAVNPLLLPALDSFKNVPESPETRMLKQWADKNQVSPFGLDIDMSQLDRSKLFDIVGRELSSIQPLHIIDIFQRMAAFFLDPEQNGLVMIGYQDIELARFADDFLIGRAGIYRPGYFEHIEMEKVPGHKLELFLNTFKPEKVDGFSIFFTGELETKELVELDQGRDRFINLNYKKMTWWIPYNQLLGYFKYWPQLRQFCKIFRLEEDIASLSLEEIKEDLEEIKHLDYDESVSKDLERRLEYVLKYLERVKKGNGKGEKNGKKGSRKK